MCFVGPIPVDLSISVTASQQQSSCRDWSARESNPELFGVSDRQSKPSKRPSFHPSLAEMLATSLFWRSVYALARGQLHAETQPRTLAVSKNV